MNLIIQANMQNRLMPGHRGGEETLPPLLPPAIGEL